jgi:hypothetical protein
MLSPPPPQCGLLYDMMSSKTIRNIRMTMILKVPSGQIGSRTSTAICFRFFNFVLEYLRRDKSSEPLHTKIHLILLLVGITGCLESFLPIGWRTFI